MTIIPNDEIFGTIKLSPAEAAREYAAGYEAGKIAGGNVAVGKLFRGAFGYADNYAGSSKACRETPAWKGACEGYLAGLSAKAVMVDRNGFVTSLES